MPASLQNQLRRALGDRLPNGGSDTDAFFTNAEIQELLDETGSNITLAALRGWEAKLAEYVKLVDIDENASNRKLSQLSRNAFLMVKHYADRNGLDGDAIVGRVVGKTVNLREDEWERVQATSGTFRAFRGYPAAGIETT